MMFPSSASAVGVVVRGKHQVEPLHRGTFPRPACCGSWQPEPLGAGERFPRAIFAGCGNQNLWVLASILSAPPRGSALQGARMPLGTPNSARPTRARAAVTRQNSKHQSPLLDPADPGQIYGVRMEGVFSGVFV